MHDVVEWPVPRLADRLDDTENGPSGDEGEKEAKRQRSEPTTPISTSSRLPHEYDEVMGITQVDPREAERIEAGLDLEYHDASENLPSNEMPEQPQIADLDHGGCGNSSLRECIELLNNTMRKAPATLHFGIENEDSVDPQQVMSPSVEQRQTTVNLQTSGPMSSDTSLLKDEPQTRISQVKPEAISSKQERPASDVKEELSEPEAKEQSSEAQEVKEETQPPDSEDSIDAERVADELRRLTESQEHATDVIANCASDEGAAAPTSAHPQGEATASDLPWNRETDGPYAPQRSGRLQSPSPSMFHSTIWVEHDQEASARAHDDPVRQLHDRVYVM